MTYLESSEGLTITRERAINEIVNVHQLERIELLTFYEEMGDKETYLASDVLKWLGY